MPHPTRIGRIVTKSVFLMCLSLVSPLASIAKPWRGIVPLHSTRADVERLFGKPNIDRDIYDFPEERASIRYSDGSQCEEGVPGLGNIPRGTVLEIYASLPRGLRLSDIVIPGKEYV